jgi:3-deoxy-manno-octulosonate cytidylyltransferase (CMP-KDO synthetase)
VLADLAGDPVVWHAYRRLAAARTVGRTIVATDSDDVARVVRELGGESVLVRTPCPTGSDRVALAARGTDADIVVNLQADQPLIDPPDIDAAVRLLEADPELDMTTLAFRSDDAEAFEDSHVVKVVTTPEGRALYFSRAPVPGAPAGTGSGWYLHHVGLYCFRRSALERFAALEQGPLERRESLEQLRALEHGMTIGVATATSATWSIDRESDLDIVRARLAAEDRSL